MLTFVPSLRVHYRGQILSASCGDATSINESKPHYQPISGTKPDLDAVETCLKCI